MIDKYLERGEMFVLDDNGVKAECVVTNEDASYCERGTSTVITEKDYR